MAKPSQFPQIVENVTEDVTHHSRDFSKFLSSQYGFTRVTANTYIRQLEEEGWIARSGPSTHPVFSPGYRRKITKHYALAGLQEDQVWEKDFVPLLQLRPNIAKIADYGFTEMVNNAIDHSEGTLLTASVRQNESSLTIILIDDGVGVFSKIKNALGLTDYNQAMFELSKGKLTTDPKNHTGEGIFFTSRMFDDFLLMANGVKFFHSAPIQFDSLEEIAPKVRRATIGTDLLMSVRLNSERTTREVFEKFMGLPDDFDFATTIVPIRLSKFGDASLVSRSQAKRLVARLDKFKKVLLDFADVDEIGQGFADELFRVYANEHPNLQLTPINMTRDVERMWLRVTVPRP